MSTDIPLLPRGSHFSCFAKKSNQKKATPTIVLILRCSEKSGTKKTRFAQTVFRSDRFFLPLLGANQRGPVEPIFDRFAMRARVGACMVARLDIRDEAESSANSLDFSELMHLLYDIATEPIAWASVYLLWFGALAAAFFSAVIGLGDPRPQSELRQHRILYFTIAAIALSVALVGTTLGLVNRSKCIALVDSASIIEGPVQELKRGRAAYSQYRFRVMDESFNTQPAVFYGCGFVRSVTDITSLANGDYVRVIFDGPRILKVSRREP